MQRRQKEAMDAYEAQWAGGLGSFHPDYDPEAMSSEDFRKAKRETEELYNAIVKNDVAQVGNGANVGVSENGGKWLSMSQTG